MFGKEGFQLYKQVNFFSTAPNCARLSFDTESAFFYVLVLKCGHWEPILRLELRVVWLLGRFGRALLLVISNLRRKTSILVLVLFRMPIQI